ncbi:MULTISPECIES: DUF411 domain-containing protein [Halomonadaceae]|uniref:DUF411 domain-containing protein n=1 Tax=Halomonadaceae TaxID=28256 RepID=UPI00159AE70B|nr:MULTISPECIES: DUF411 domain-containing protein [Halomonas]QJQ94533.1 DUF411 domain-containing protein [Halomonas sp. PA5]
MIPSIRRSVAGSLLALMATASWASEPMVEMFKDPNCGCCSAWAEHLEAEGFVVHAHDARDMRAVKAEHGVPPALASCHTALVDGYVIEGHVPAADIRRLLEEGSDIVGLAVPGMPHGSPGMETGRVDDYEVISWRQGEEPEVFQRYMQQ